MSKIGPKMAAVKQFVETHPGCIAIAAAKHVAPGRAQAYGIGYGYQTVWRAVSAKLIDVTTNPAKRGTYLLWPRIEFEFGGELHTALEVAFHILAGGAR